MNGLANRESDVKVFDSSRRRMALQGIADNIESIAMPILGCNRWELLAGRRADQCGHAGDVPVVPCRREPLELGRDKRRLWPARASRTPKSHYPSWGRRLHD